MKRVLVCFAVVLVVSGAIAGPAYDWYAVRLSGEPVDTFVVGDRGSAWPLSGGTVLKFPANRGFKPLDIDLDPEMNPVRFTWIGEVSYSRQAGNSRNEYKGSLYLNGRGVMSEKFSISGSDEDDGATESSTSIGTVRVPSAGRYQFVLEETTQPPLPARDIRIEVRRNTVVPAMGVVISGYLMTFAGFILGVLSFLSGALRGPGALATKRRNETLRALLWLCVFVLVLGGLFYGKSVGILP